ncbi:polyhydroxyalkanoate synthesis repressor PhaR [Rickettsiales endosymbiont of Peranema trichophorum]|uniref:polyhydroxyalkanoate synthesis repressor PhaR n=1 Tax=Rickettsiales endosymbiont of Peranema trichophorum TaxID=2486577 RepID=UPI001A91D73D|nr:polyhydroxyalkanoate synthesis repressor PhaR [Rickettsiales endosymbiont of Peranema trichophorum]
MSENKKLVIKKYANRRLYSLTSSSYITLDELKELIKRGYDIEVLDAKTGEDLTRLTLTQIILECETKGYKLLSTSCLKQIIMLYDNKMAETFYDYIAECVKSFNHQQEHIEQFQKIVSNPVIEIHQHWSEVLQNLTAEHLSLVQEMTKNMQSSKSKDANKTTNQ